MRTLLTILISSILLAACQDGANKFSDPEELIVCMAITEDYDKTASKVHALKDYLSSTLNMPVTIHKLSNGTAIIEAIKAEKAHMGGVGAFSYLIAKSKIDISPMVTTASATPDTLHKYWSHLIVPSNSNIHNIEDLKAQVGSTSLAWSYPTSTSGHLIPRGYLKSIGIVQADFEQVIVAENHAAAIYNCIKGKVDMAAVSNVTLAEYLKRGKIHKEDYRIIWSSEPIIRGSIFIHNKVNPVLQKKIKEALVNLYEKDPEAARSIHYQYEYDVKYVPVDDKEYDQLRAIAKDIGLKLG